MKSPIHQDTRIAAFAEGQMRTWGRLQETASRAANRQKPGPSLARAVEFVAVSREAGADGRRHSPNGGRAAWLEGVRRKSVGSSCPTLQRIAVDARPGRRDREQLGLRRLGHVDGSTDHSARKVCGPGRSLDPSRGPKRQRGVRRPRGAICSCRGRRPSPCGSWRRRHFAPSACGSGVRSPCRKPWSGFAAPTAVAASSSSDSSTRISTIRTSTIWSSTPNALVWLGPPTRSCMRMHRAVGPFCRKGRLCGGAAEQTGRFSHGS